MNTPAVGYILKMFPRLSETFILNEIRELERQGLSLKIFSLKRPPGGAGQAVGVRAAVIYLPERVWREPVRVLRAHWGVARRFPRGYGQAWLHLVWGRQLSSLGRGFRRFCQTCCLVHELGEIRHLHAHFATDPTRLASWANLICQVPFSVTTHAKDLYQAGRLTSPVLAFKLARAKFVVANSAFSTEALRAIVQGKTPVVTIYNGVEPGDFPQARPEPAEPLILSVGRLVEKKGFQTLIEACQVLKTWGVKFRCQIIGGGPLEGALKEGIKHYGLENEVSLPGALAHEEVCGRYCSATVFALPCQVAPDGDRDILPNVVKEAMAAGVPVVTSRLEGIEELITHGQSGVLVAPGAPRTLAAALKLLLENPGLRQGLSGRARAVIEERFDLRKNFGRLKELLLEALPENCPRVAPSAPSQSHELVA